MAVIHFATDFDPIPCGAPIHKHATSDMKRVTCQRCLQTKFFRQCKECAEREEYEHDNEDYLRAAANYDGEGKDWR